MTNDGSSLGINAERALKTILGGEPEPDESEQETRENVRLRLSKVPRIQDIHLRHENRLDGDVFGSVEVLYWQGKELDIGYGEAADVAARAILDFLEAHPEHADAPGENEYSKDAWKGFDGNSANFPKPIRQGLYDLMKGTEYDLGKLGLTGFMWGFAYNTARRLRYEEGESNPAIVEI